MKHEILIINGPTKLSGHVSISGSKNSALPILAATLCCSSTCKIINVPNISDIHKMTSILESVGAQIQVNGDEIVINSDGICCKEPFPDEVQKMRGGFFVIGPLVGRFGEAVVALPGGCDIGARPVDLFIQGLRALGAIVQIRDGKVNAWAANGRGLVGGNFQLDFPSVGATETLMMAACLADGDTILSNVAKEPEVVDLAKFLRACGAIVEGEGTEKMLIKGKAKLLNGSEWKVMPDRIEAGSFMLAAAITRSSISISPVIPSHLSSLTQKLIASGCKITLLDPHILQVSADEELNSFDIKTDVFPGFPTDLQPQTMALLTTCTGFSIVEESVFEHRMNHAMEMMKTGANLEVHGRTALIHGKVKGSELQGSHLIAPDLRGGMSLVLVAMAAQGTSEIRNVIHIDRGYENLVRKLQCLGADIKRSSVSFME